MGAFATVPPLPDLSMFEKVLCAGTLVVHTPIMANTTMNAPTNASTDQARRGWHLFCLGHVRPESCRQTAGWDLAKRMHETTGILPMASERYLVRHSSDVSPGMVIVAPEALADDDAPTRVTVEDWDWDGGETLLTWPGGCADYNVADLGGAQMMAMTAAPIERATCTVDRFRS